MAKKKKAKARKKSSVKKSKLKSKKSRGKTSKKKVSKKRGKKKASARAKQKVLAQPKGYHSITPYLIVNNAAEAIGFYKNAFAAKELKRMEHSGGRVAHAELKIGDAKIMLADEHPEMNARAPQSFGGTPVSIHLYVKNVDGVVDRALSAGATLLSPIENMFYGDRSGTVEDPFGHKWHVSTHVENVSNAEIKKRAAEVFNRNL